MSEADFEATLAYYFHQGDKSSGGAADNAVGAWLEGQLTTLGYNCRRQTLDVPFFTPSVARLETDGAAAPVIPQAIVIPTGPDGLSAPLALASDPRSHMQGALALIILAHRRWSSASDPEVSGPIRAALAAGAVGAVVVTTGPTGEALALNAPAAKPLFDRPVVCLAPRDQAPFLRAAQLGLPGRLRVEGQAGRRTAFNLIARLDRRAPRTLVISTPRSGWFSCAGERGPGLAVWLALARWAALRALPVNIELLCTSGHEYDNAGGELYISRLAPPPNLVSLWVHLGANVAARDWHERGGLTPLPSADPQRIMMASAPLLPALKRAFAGYPGVEQPYLASVRASAGELTNILKAGYEPAVGIFGTHRFHHAAGDDLRCVSPVLARKVADAFVALIDQQLGA